MPTPELNTFTRAYIDCALWSSNDESDESGGESMDQNYSITDIAPATLELMTTDCSEFQESNEALLKVWSETAGQDDIQAGHDFWLTRNRHGAGYWDRWSGGSPQSIIGRKLTDAAHAAGSFDLYIGPDGKVHSPGA
jgi:hypothetical protein